MAVKLDIETNVNTKGVEKLNKETKKTTESAKESNEAYNDLGNSLDKMTGGAITFAGKLVSGVKKGVAVMKTLRGAIISTGIGALVVAVGTLVSYFTNTQRGADKIDKVFKALGATVDVLIDRVSSFGEGLYQIITGDFEAGYETLKNAISGVGEEIAKESKAAFELAEARQKLRDEEIAFIKVQAEKTRAIEKARLDAEDEQKTDEERADALREAIRLQNELTEQKIKFAKENARIIREQVALGESSSEDLREQAEAEARVIELETERDRRLRSVQTRLNAFTQGVKDLNKATEKSIELKQTEKLMDIQSLGMTSIEDDPQVKRVKTIEETKRTEAQKTQDFLMSLGKQKMSFDQLLASFDDDITEQKKNNQYALLAATQSVLNAGMAIAAEGSEAAKGFASAQALFSAFLAINKTLGDPKLPFPYNAIIASSIGAQALFNVAKINSIDAKKGSASSASSGSINISAPRDTEQDRVPEFGFINRGVGGQQGSDFGSPRAYVVLQDLRNKESLDERIRDSARLG